MRRCLAPAVVARAFGAARSASSVNLDPQPVAPALRTESRRHRKLYELTMKEEREEGLRDFLPVRPLLPAGWKLTHTIGTNRFEVEKTVEIRSCGVEKMRVVALLERKQYESTYRMDNGERDEQEYLNFTLFLTKERYPSGGLEFGLTSIDMELVLDALTIHPTSAQLENARRCFDASSKKTTNLRRRKVRDAAYRGPMLSELDEDFSDEILDYLDERGVNNTFAEFMMSQAYYLEQEEYLHWLRLLRKFSD